MNAGTLLERLSEGGMGRPVRAGPGVGRALAVGNIEVAIAESGGDTFLRARWRARVRKTPKPYLLLADDPERSGRVRALGPSSPTGVIRSVDAAVLADSLVEVAALSAFDAVRRLAGDLPRMGGDGLAFNGVLTRHTLEHRFQKDAARWGPASDLVNGVVPEDDWRRLLTKLGYVLERLPLRGYLARHEGRPVALVHPKSRARDFARLDTEGRPPEGVLLADCAGQGVPYGILAQGGRIRLFDATSASPASEWLEIDARLLGTDRLPFLALLAPPCLADGAFAQLRQEARSFGVGLSRRIDHKIRHEALPSLATGMEGWARRRGMDLSGDDERLELERAALTLVFRIIFVLFGESSGHLPMSNRAYEKASLSSLVREACETMSQLSPASTALWAGFTRLVRALRVGNPAWDMPPYNGALFADSDFDGAQLLEEMELPDPDFARVLVAIGQDDETIRGADFSTLDIAHIGHTYESLLSLRLSLARRPLRYDAGEDRYVGVAAGQEAEVETGGLLWQTHEGGRKAGGVYYTPVDIVRHLVEGAVLPAYKRHLATVEETASTDPAAAARELLSFAVVDPACGSAHFLVQVAETLAEETIRFLAKRPLPDLLAEVDRLRDGTEPGAEIDDVALLRRLIVKRCVFGVDRSRMGAEVAILSLWLASFVPGMSLAYLNRNVVVGDSLIGVGDPGKVLEEGGLFTNILREHLGTATEAVARMADIHDRTPGEVEASKRADEEATAATAGLKRLFDLWTAERFALTGAQDYARLHAGDVIAGTGAGDVALVRRARELAQEHAFLHWPLAFPQVFSRERPGFDVVVGNPPWEEVTIEELAFYGMFLPGVNSLREGERDVALTRLVRERPELEGRFQARQDKLQIQRRALAAGDYEPMGGDPDLYKYFCQRYDMLVREGGFTGVVLPRTAFNAKGSEGFRDWLYTQSTTHRVDFLLNSGRWIFDSEPRYSIALVAAERASPRSEHRPGVVGTATSPAAWREQSSRDPIRLAPSAFGPGWQTPLIRSQEEADLLARLRTGSRFPYGAGGRWRCFPVAELHETNDKLFWRGSTEGEPLWKGASFDQYDPRGTDERPCPVTPELLKKIRKPRPGLGSLLASEVPLADRKRAVLKELDRARLAFRDLSRSTDSRTIRACLIPPGIFLTNMAPYLTFVEGGSDDQAACLGVMNSLPFDWQARRFIEIHANFFLLEGLRLPDLEDLEFDAISEAAAQLSAVDERFAEFADATNVPVGALSASERTRLRIEIDARVARAWHLTSDDLRLMYRDFSEDAVTPAYRATLLSRLEELS